MVDFRQVARSWYQTASRPKKCAHIESGIVRVTILRVGMPGNTIPVQIGMACVDAGRTALQMEIISSSIHKERIGIDVTISKPTTGDVAKFDQGRVVRVIHGDSSITTGGPDNIIDYPMSR